MTSSERVPPALKQGERRRWLAVIGVLVVVIYLAWSSIVLQSTKTEADRTDANQKRLVDCIATYVSLASQRAAIIGPYTAQETTAQNVLNNIAVGDPHRPAAVKALHEAQAALALEQRKYPPPKFTCAVRLSKPVKLIPSLVSSNAPALPTTVPSTPGAGVTRTRTATATATVSGPTKTRTQTRTVPVQRPGLTVTVTRTVSPPSCLTHPVPPCVLDLRR